MVIRLTDLWCCLWCVGIIKCSAQQGESAIMQYIHNLAWQGGQAVASIWKTEIVAQVSSVPSVCLSVRRVFVLAACCVLLGWLLHVAACCRVSASVELTLALD